jgi:acetyl-CoA carboxylase biotin carboxyl carrier protein
MSISKESKLTEGLVELKQIKELMAAMGRTGMLRVSIKKEGFELELEREDNGLVKPSEQYFENEELFRSEMEMNRANIALGRGSELAAIRMAAAKGTEAEAKEEPPGSYITAPMVGTFYSSPSPEDPAFVKVGDKVEKNSVVCIVEAMKVMNEVKAGISGTVAEVLVESSHPVEFGTKLFRIV